MQRHFDLQETFCPSSRVDMSFFHFFFSIFLFLGHFFAVGTRCALSDGKIIATILRGLGCKHKCMVPVLTNNTRIKCTAREGRSKSSGWRRSLFVQGQVANGDLSRSVNGLRGFMLQCQENLGVQLPRNVTVDSPCVAAGYRAKDTAVPDYHRRVTVDLSW